MLCHLPDLEDIVVFHGSNGELVIEIPTEIDDFGSMSSVDELFI
jgi:hypothetical protein